ncbi:MAG: response regulator [Patescibacteria group bacterium]
MATNEKILIIESDASVGQGLVTALQDEGYSPIWAKTGTEGLTMMFDILPRLILLDVTLPDIRGYEVLEKKQAESVLSKIPVFLMSAQGEPINMQDVPQGSVSEFLMALHADPKDVIVKINTLLRPGSSTSAAVPKKGKEKKILWVEDDKLIGTILAKKIVSSGFELFHAKNGEEALEIISHETPDAIVVDLLLPGMSGFDILQKIQMDPAKKNIPTMVLSNLSKPSDIEKAKVLGAKKFLVKAATSLDQIVAEIKELCG